MWLSTARCTRFIYVKGEKWDGNWEKSEGRLSAYLKPENDGINHRRKQYTVPWSFYVSMHER